MKVFGNGFLAKNLKKINIPKVFFIYAAGVSNSNLKIKKEYKREIFKFRQTLKKVNKKRVFVYISSLSVENKYLKNDLYVKNKLKIENILKNQFENYIIIRLPQIVGKNKNKNTLTNSIYNFFRNNKKFIIWKDSVRNLIDIDDINKILEKYFKKYNYKSSNKKIINIFNPRSIPVLELLQIFTKLLGKRINYKLLKKNNKNINLKIIKRDTLLPKMYYKNLKKKNYIKNVLKKHYL